MASSPQASCLSDPNFAVICAFLERFAKYCGITYPTFADLQEMLENVEQVPQELIDLHIKLLRKARKTVFIEKWEKALIKFCHTYSSQDGWEIERFGYKKSRLEVKLRVLKMLLEGQFDLNSKFKASINTLESEELRSKPLGKDNSGRIYWLQFDSTSNIRVYREDLDDESWTLVAQDRASMVQLLQELSGGKFPELDINLVKDGNTHIDTEKPVVDTGQNGVPNLFENFKENNHEINNDSNEQNLLETKNNQINTDNVEDKPKISSRLNEDFSKPNENCGINVSKQDSINKGEHVIPSENLENMNNLVANGKSVTSVPCNEKISIDDDGALDSGIIEEPVMYIVGEGEGADCMTGNPDRETQSEGGDQKLPPDKVAENEQLKSSSQISSGVNPSSNINVDKLKPTPKLWSIDAICGVNRNKEMNETVNSCDKQENADLQSKQKNFSTFSIDSVLEKKEVNAHPENTLVSKLSVDSPCDPSSVCVPAKEDPSNSVNESNLTDVNNSVMNSVNNLNSLNVSLNNVTSKTELDPQGVELKDDKCSEKIVVYNVEEEECGKEQILGSEILNKNLTDGSIEIEKKEEADGTKDETDSFLMESTDETKSNPIFISSEDKIFYTPDSDKGTEDKSGNETFHLKNKDTDILNEEIDIKPSDATLDKESVKDSEDEKNIVESNLSVEPFTDVQKSSSLINMENDDPKSESTTEETEKIKIENYNEKNVEEIIPEIQQCQDGAHNSEHSQENIHQSDTTNSKLTSENSLASEESKPCDVDFSKEMILSKDSNEALFKNSESIKFGDEDIIHKKVEAEGEADANKISSLIKVEVNDVEISTSAGLSESENKVGDNSSKESTPEIKVPDEIASEAVQTISENTSNAETTTAEPTKSQDEIEELELSKSELEETLDIDSKTIDETNENINSADETKKRKKKVYPLRVLSRNRKTIEESKPEENFENPSDVKIRRKSRTSAEITEEISASKNEMETDIKIQDESIENNEEQEEAKKNLDTMDVDPHREEFPLDETKKEKESSMPISSLHKGKKSSRRRRKFKNHTAPAVVQITTGEAENNAHTIVNSGNEEEDEEEEEKKKEDGSAKKKGRPRREETSRPGGRQIPAREIKLLGITDVEIELPSIRQSRRIAQIKMKEEAERRRIEALQLESFKNKKKSSKSGKKKSKKTADTDSFDENNENEANDSDCQKLKDGKEKKLRKKRKKDKLNFNELNPWLSSSESSSADDDEEEIEEEQHEDEELVFKSDHEFSPESDVEDPDYKPMKRARTARLEESKDEAGKYDDTSCEKCGKNDHPEWILLCDTCDKGWHASCVRPALMVIPEGDWYCPPCEHQALIVKLQESLLQYDRCQKQRENEELRKKRLAFVGISLDNVLPSTKKTSRAEGSSNEKEDTDSNSGSSPDSESSDSGSDSEDSSEPVYQLRERRSNVTSYRYNEYDELIKSALQDEIEAVKGAGNSGRGKDINNIVLAEKQKKDYEEDIPSGQNNFYKTGDTAVDKAEEESDADSKQKVKSKKGEDDDYEIESDEENEENESENVTDEIPPVVPKYNNKKKKSKSLKITSLDFTSEEEDHNSDSDFKGVSSEEESDYSLMSESESSDDRRKRKGDEGPVRRSTRARISRYDRDFINDDSDDSPKRKKNSRMWDSSESSDSDRSWGRRKRRGNKSYSRNSGKKSSSGGKKKRQRKRNSDFERDESLTPKKPRSRKIKYGGLDSLDEEKVLTRRTRGKKINYQEITGSDSEEDGKKQKARGLRVIESDDDFVAENEKEEDLQEAESEETESEIDEDEDEDEECDNKLDVKKLETIKKKKKVVDRLKKKWVIPGYENDESRMDEELKKFGKELKELDEEEENILEKILESGEYPIEELKTAIKRAKDEKKIKQIDEGVSPTKSVPIRGHSDLSGSEVKFSRLGKMNVSSNCSELASQLTKPPKNVTSLNTDAKFYIQNIGEKIDTSKSIEKQELKEKSLDSRGPAHSHQKNTNLVDGNIPVNHYIANDSALHVPRPLISYSMEAPPDTSLSMMAMMTSQAHNTPGSSTESFDMTQPPNISRPLPQFNAFQGILPSSRGPAYPSPIPTTILGMSDMDSQSQSKRKPAPKVKRKLDDTSLLSDKSSDFTETSDVHSLLRQDDFSNMKGVQDSPPKKKGRGRGKKQLLAEKQTLAHVRTKQDTPAPLVQSSNLFPTRALPTEGNSVITRMLNSPQGPPTYTGSDSSTFPPVLQARPPFAPPIPPHFSNSPRHLPPMRLRPTIPSTTMFHTSHPLDPSPSGGGAISVPTTNSALGKLSQPPSTFTRVPGLPIIPSRFAPDSGARLTFPSQGNPQRPEFSFTNYYASFPHGGPTLPGSENPNFQSPAFQEPFGEEVHLSGGVSSKHYEDETSGEFGGLASYFASQREDDIDT